MNKEEHAKIVLEKVTEIEDLKSELRGKDKIIGKMVDYIAKNSNETRILCRDSESECRQDCYSCVIEYFEDEVLKDER